MNNKSKIKELVLESFEKTIIWGNSRTDLNLYEIERYVHENIQTNPDEGNFELKVIINECLSELVRIGMVEYKLLKGYPFILYNINKSKIRDNKINEILNGDKTK